MAIIVQVRLKKLIHRRKLIEKASIFQEKFMAFNPASIILPEITSSCSHTL